MKPFSSRAGGAGSWFVLCLVLAECSSAADANGPAGSEETGEVSAAIQRVPDDTRCVSISLYAYGSFYTNRYVEQDVVPGESAVIRIGSLPPGYAYISGNAYGTACRGPYGFDAGETQTWTADSTSVYVQAGRTTEVSLNFHKLGAVHIGINFDECSCDQYGVCTTLDESGATVACIPSGGGPSVDGGVVVPVEGGVTRLDASAGF